MNGSRPANFDRLARTYRALEYVAFGRDLERVRFFFLPELTDRRNILIFGEGDGRFLARLLTTAPMARVTSVDASAGMIARASERIGAAARDRVTFVQADARTFDFAAGSFDAVVTHFFLDCFTDAEAEAIVRAVTAHLAADARWIWGDFVVPPGRLGAIRSRVWLALLYTFFRWEIGLRVRRLPDAERIFTKVGLTELARRDFQAGMLRTAVYRRR